jgi:hypothetical protein
MEVVTVARASNNQSKTLLGHTSCSTADVLIDSTLRCNTSDIVFSGCHSYLLLKAVKNGEQAVKKAVMRVAYEQLLTYEC